MGHINYHLERDGREITVGVDYDYHSGSKGSYYEPPEDAFVEVTGVFDIGPDGKLVEVEVTDEERERIEAACMDDVQDRYEAAMEAKAEEMAERRCEVIRPWNGGLYNRPGTEHDPDPGAFWRG